MSKLFRLQSGRIASFHRLLQFFSMAVLTQLILMLSQLLVLPIQVHLWGDSATASWYAAIAIANITTIADCGLRLAGHAELLRSRRNPTDVASAEQFRQVWAWIRVLIVAVTAMVILGDALYATVLRSAPYPFWKAALAGASALETVLIVRIIYLDSLGFYRAAEGGYLFFAALRLMLSLAGMVVFRLHADGLGWLFLASSVPAVAWQEWICRKTGGLGLLERPPRKLSSRVLALARHTWAEPSANWVRLSLPVLVLASLAPPLAVEAYVGLRAVFGVARTSIQQLARVASVEYLRIRNAGRTITAESILGMFLLVAVALGAIFASAVEVDNLRLLSLWLRHVDRWTFQMIAASFGVSAPFYAYQIVLCLLFRGGELGHVSRRLYAFVIYSGLFAAGALALGSFRVYLILLACAEMLLSVSFMRMKLDEGEGNSRAGQPAVVFASFGSILVLALWAAITGTSARVFLDVSPAAVGWSLLYFSMTAVVLAAFAWVTNPELARAVVRQYGARSGIAQEPPDLLPVPLDEEPELHQPTLVP